LVSIVDESEKESERFFRSGECSGIVGVVRPALLWSGIGRMAPLSTPSNRATQI
jgi:hypothetical protein